MSMEKIKIVDREVETNKKENKKKKKVREEKSISKFAFGYTNGLNYHLSIYSSDHTFHLFSTNTTDMYDYQSENTKDERMKFKGTKSILYI